MTPAFRLVILVALTLFLGLSGTAQATTVLLDLSTNSCGPITGAHTGCYLSVTAPGPGSSGFVSIGSEVTAGTLAILAAGGDLTNTSTYAAELYIPGDSSHGGLTGDTVELILGPFSTPVTSGVLEGTGSFGGVDGSLTSTSSLTIYVAGLGNVDTPYYAYAVNINTPSAGGGGTTDAPEPSSFLLAAAGVVFVAYKLRKHKPA